MTTCALCSAPEKLEQSHLIPRFVYRGLGAPDGPSRPFLCGACEDRFSRWESRFARDVFHPLVAGKATPVKYGRWLLKFATSVCWRILENARRENQLQGHDSATIDACLKTWTDFLRDRRPDVGAHHLHLLRESRGLQREIKAEVAGRDGAAWVYVRMGPLALFGLIRDDSPGQWSGTRIHLEGKLKPRVCVIPERYAQHLARRG